MEFSEKLKLLRKEQNLTQESLANVLYVSRGAISKWESGRGYPSIDSLKLLASYFSVSIDDLISDQVINTKKSNISNYVWIDLVALCYFLIPLYGQKVGDFVEAVPLYRLIHVPKYILIMYLIVYVFQGCLSMVEWVHEKFVSIKGMNIVSILFSLFATCLFIITQQPYIAVLHLVTVVLKSYLKLKKK